MGNVTNLAIVNDLTISEIVDFEAYYRNNGMLDFKLEELQSFTLNPTQDKKELTGRNGNVIGYKKQNKKVSGSGTNGIVSAGLLKTQTGGEISYGTYNIKKSEVKTVAGKTLTTDAVALGTVGNEIGYLKEFSLNGSVIATYQQGVTADATHFAYDPQTNEITLPVDDNDKGIIADGTKVVYAYERAVEATKVTNPSDKYSEVREVWIHAFGTDACENEYYLAIHIPRADFSGEFSLELGGDQTVHNFSFDALPDLCAATNGKASDLFDVFIYTNDGEMIATKSR